MPKTVAELLAAWRAADRRWEATTQDDPGFRAVGIDVVGAWLEYHAAIDERHPGEFVLVADDDRSIVAAGAGVEANLGRAPDAILGLRIEDLAAPGVVADTEMLWAAFISEGRMDGTFELTHRDGSVVRLHYQARAHYPIASFHLSRLWPEADLKD